MSNPMQDNASEPPAVSFYASAISTENHISEHGSIGAPRQNHVCFGSEADISPRPTDVRFALKSGHYAAQQNHPIGSPRQRRRAELAAP
jgi:hypothetical protein